MRPVEKGRRGDEPALTSLSESSCSVGVDSPFFSAIVLFKDQPFRQGFWWFH